MVITSTSQADGHAQQQPVVIEGQETQDPDEPPLPLQASALTRDQKLSDSATKLQDVEKGHHAATIEAKVDWDRDPGTAHTFDGKSVAAFLNVDPKTGLSHEEALNRLKRDGHNKLDGAGQVSVAKVLLRQVSNRLTILLLIAMALSYGTLDFTGGAVISAVILLNIVLGFVQDYRAERTMQALLSLAVSNPHVLRNGRVETIKAEDLVWTKFWFGLKDILGLVGTPMQVKLSQFAILLFGLAVFLVIIIFSANKWDLQNEVALYGICVAVAIIPGSLNVVMAITVAVGVKAMAQGNVVVRRMAALEAIGGVTNICSDKTRTLTQGKMPAHKAWVPNMGGLIVEDTTTRLNPSEGILDTDGQILDPASLVSHTKFDLLRPVLDSVSLCNFATIARRNESEKASLVRQWTVTGDPTEIALQVLAMRFR